MLLVAIAAPAIIGFSSNPHTGDSAPAATGMLITLYINAQKRFCFMVSTVALDAEWHPPSFVSRTI